MASNLIPFFRGRIHWAGKKAKQWRRKTANPWGRAKRLTAAIQAVKPLRRIRLRTLSHTPSTIHGCMRPSSQRGAYSHPARIQPCGATTPAISATDSTSASMGAMDLPNSIESFGSLIRAGIDDPFGYSDPVPRSDDYESSFDDYFDDSEVDDTFSFLRPGHQALEAPSRSPTDSPALIIRPAIGEKMFGGQNEDI
ncbi:hypothetical protein B0H13DRAFT_1956799 [Mycena leptocephala]|nr:hypothetical protein B0H13DRAFT_1956799 [Mycena leptocephala]